MNPTNEIILKLVLASPVGKAMSDADRQALAKTLETTDAQDVQGWLGDQIRKAASVFKGDFVGHPFRGNQHSDSSGVSQGGAGSGSGEPRKRGWDDLSIADQKEFSDRHIAAKTEAERRAIVAEFKIRIAGGSAKGPKNLGIKAGEYQTISANGMDYDGEVLGIKNGVVTLLTTNRANGEDYDEPREIDIKLVDVDYVDGVKNDAKTKAIEDRVAEVDAKLSDAKRMRETSAQQERARLGLPKEETAGKPPMSSAGKRTVAAANRSLKAFREVVDELDALEASRDQIIDDLVNEEGVSRKNATQDVDDDIAVLRYAVNQSKFKGQEGETEGEKKVRERSEQAANTERGRQRAEREEAASTARRGKLTPVDDDNIDKPLKGEEATEFKAGVKEAKAAIKQTRELIAELRAKANEKATRSMLGTKRLDDVQMALQEAQDETDRFEDIVNSNSKASIRSAVSISTMGVDVGETVKGYVRQAASDMKLNIDASREASLQSAGDKNFGVSGDKYDVEAAFDYVGN